MSACASLDAGHASVVPAAKVDSGLGDLPHYRNWVDPTGRAPMEPVLTASVVPAGKVDSGLGDLPHYRDWVDPSGRMPTYSTADGERHDSLSPRGCSVAARSPSRAPHAAPGVGAHL